MITFECQEGGVLQLNIVPLIALVAWEVTTTFGWQKFKEDKKIWSYMPKNAIKPSVFVEKMVVQANLFASYDYAGWVFELSIVSGLRFWY